MNPETDCIFCRIVRGEIPAELLYQDDQIVAFKDISAKAPVHFLIIPRRHIETVNDLAPEEDELTGKMIRVARDLAAANNIAESGYRLVLNCNADGGQEVFHIHLHLLGGRKMTWPPG